MPRRPRPRLRARLILLCACLCASVSLWHIPAAADRPNIVFILADDLGYADLACYGSSFYETPALDALAKQGVRFTSAYAACPVCSPTRAALLTGRYPARVHITAFVGKWHLGGPAFYPDKHGFDLNVAGCDLGHPPSYFPPYKIPTLPDGPRGEYLTDRLTDEAIKFIDASKDKPFLLYLSHYAVHNPKQCRPDLVDKYKAKLAKIPGPHEPKFRLEGQSKDRRSQEDPTYAGMVEAVDQSVARVLAELDRLHLSERTVVIFTSDNGGLSTSEGTPTSNAPLRAGKGWLYEGGIREPFIVRWPGVTPAGATCDVPITSPDLFPTLLEIAGLPPRPAEHVDGVSAAPLLRAPATARLADRDLFWHYPHYGNQGGRPGAAIRSGDLKLIEFFEDDRVELYNVKQDLEESTDLAAKLPDRAADLRARLHAWQKAVGAAPTRPKPDYKPGQPPAAPKPAKGQPRALLD